MKQRSHRADVPKAVKLTAAIASTLLQCVNIPDKFTLDISGIPIESQCKSTEILWVTWEVCLNQHDDKYLYLAQHLTFTLIISPAFIVIYRIFLLEICLCILPCIFILFLQLLLLTIKIFRLTNPLSSRNKEVKAIFLATHLTLILFIFFIYTPIHYIALHLSVFNLRLIYTEIRGIYPRGIFLFDLTQRIEQQALSARRRPVVGSSGSGLLSISMLESTVVNKNFQTCLLTGCEQSHQWPLLLTWFNFNPSMDK